jgi:ketosteroid isomerase-like protein
MRLRRSLAVSLLSLGIALPALLASCGSTTRAAPSAPAREPARDLVAEVRAAADEFDLAQVHGDRATLERYLASDFVFVRGSGKVSGRDSFLAAFTTPGDTLDPFELVDRKLIPLGRDAVIATAEVTLRGSESGERFEEHLRFADVYLFRDGRWQVVYVQVTMVK